MQTDVEKRVSSKLMWRIIPFVMLLYFISFLDRVNAGFAALSMNKALGISSSAFGFGGGLFFIAYFLFEVPSNLILHRVGARVWIARVMITWGLVSAATAFVVGPKSFDLARLAQPRPDSSPASSTTSTPGFRRGNAPLPQHGSWRRSRS